MNRLKNSCGAAAFIFILILPVLICVMALSLQASQILLAQSKITEASEVTSLALSALSEERAQQKLSSYATRVLKHYLAGTDDVKGQATMQSSTFQFQTDLVGEATHEFWFKHKPQADTFKVSGASTSRKHKPQPMDVYFITDLSESMNRSDPSRLTIVKDAIRQVVSKLPKGSRAAFIGYNTENVKLTGRYFDKRTGREITSKKPTELQGPNIWAEKSIYDYLTGRHPDFVKDNLFDIALSKKKMSPIDKLLEGYVPPDLDKKIRDFETKYPFYDISLTPDLGYFKRTIQSNAINANGNTHSWNGIIAAAREAHRQPSSVFNPQQVFVLLTDGEDSKKFPKGYYAPLCEKIRNDISDKQNRSQIQNSSVEEKTKVTMSVIGVEFNPYKNEGVTECFGRENIFEAKREDELVKKILQLFEYEMGSLDY
ncbi:TadE/TadG family type IV pilus assembly protein [Vibrio caribbeanicus]|uniref:TadE/TadG family type IV pilus assembly protein n=1 Tax=Vibrio caribbeanicus TaxID=701175 RepID=UPI002284AFC1|nr:hypothetical protein [Vibrio caribbeanicus]MCY9843641.1 hypothetical protein [Vibrio caribbeanicus]